MKCKNCDGRGIVFEKSTVKVALLGMLTFGVYGLVGGYKDTCDVCKGTGIINKR